MINKISIGVLALLARGQRLTGLNGGFCVSISEGKSFDLLKVDPALIDIGDIAKGLAYKPRLSGFTPRFFSIAEHGLIMEELAGWLNDGDYCARLEALLFCAAEAYTGELAEPLERICPNFVFIRKRVQSAIYQKFGIVPGGYSQKVDLLHVRASDIEAKVFFNLVGTDKRYIYERHVKYFSPDEALEMFLYRFAWLTDKITAVGADPE